jgi:hypothetical protein
VAGIATVVVFCAGVEKIGIASAVADLGGGIAAFTPCVEGLVFDGYLKYARQLICNNRTDAYISR